MASKTVEEILKHENEAEKALEEAKIKAGIMPRPKGRSPKAAPPRDIVAEQAYKINRLKRENNFMRDFLQLTER